MTKKISILVALLLLGCDDSHNLTDLQKLEMSKQCINAGMWPDVYPSSVRCMAVPTTQVKK